jgi:RHS repeat-associated protein
VRHSVFTPFGELYAQKGGNTDRKRWAGHQLHDDTGLFYMQARWMDPNAGTFLSIDPLVGDAYDPQSANAYSYARNNPVSFTDPTGMSFQDWLRDVGRAVVVIVNGWDWGPPGEGGPGGALYHSELATGASSGPISGGGVAPSRSNTEGSRVNDGVLSAILVLGEEPIPDEVIDRLKVGPLLDLARLRIRVAKKQEVDPLIVGLAEQELVEIRRNLAIGPIGGIAQGIGLGTAVAGATNAAEAAAGAAKGLIDAVGPTRGFGGEFAEIAARNRELGETRLRRLVARPIR